TRKRSSCHRAHGTRARRRDRRAHRRRAERPMALREGGRLARGRVGRVGSEGCHRGHADPGIDGLGRSSRLGGPDSMNAPWPGPLGPPPDWPSVVATIAAMLLLWRGRVLFDALFHAPGRSALVLVAGIAVVASAVYVDHYLRGGPRIIDAT